MATFEHQNDHFRQTRNLFLIADCNEMSFFSRINPAKLLTTSSLVKYFIFPRNITECLLWFLTIMLLQLTGPTFLKDLSTLLHSDRYLIQITFYFLPPLTTLFPELPIVILFNYSSPGPGQLPAPGHSIPKNLTSRVMRVL